MSQLATFQKNFSIAGIPFQGNESVEADEAGSVVASVPAAQPGELTTRTDNDTGTLTMDNADHGILTGDKIDLYFDGGVRRRVTVGTVAGTSVPIDAGAGDNLPALNSAVRACVCIQRDLVLTVANIQAVGVKCNTESQIHFMEANGTTEDLTVHLEPTTDGQETSYEWHNGAGASPFTGTTVAKVWLSHGDTAAAHDMTVAALST